MSDNLWKKISFIVGLLPIGALFGLTAYIANIEIKDLDIWLHLAMGKYITLHGFVPSFDMLSCTIPGKLWVNHEWLFQVIVFNLFDQFGPNGVIKMQVVLVISTMLMLLIIGYNRDKQFIITFFLTLVFLVFQQRFTTRPDLFSLFFFTAYIFVLALHIDKKWSVFALAVVQILWSNIHGFFFFGPMFAGLGLMSEWMKRHVPLPAQWNDSGRLTDDEYTRLKIIFVVVTACCFVNPMFIQGAIYPLGIFFSLSGDSQIFFKYIQELQEPIGRISAFLNTKYVFYKLIIIISFVSFVFNRRRIDVSAILFWVVFLVFSLKAARNVPYFALAAYLVFVTNILNLSFNDILPFRFSSKKFEYITLIMMNGLLFFWLYNYGLGMAGQGYYDFDAHKIKSSFGGISQRGYPDKAVDFLEEHEIKGNFFNDFNSGAYLLGRVFPNIKVFIDGRTEVYGAEFFKEKYLKIWGETEIPVLEKAIEEYHLTGMLLNSSRQQIPQRLLRYLYESADWKLVYFDYDAVVFLKNIDQYKDIIEEFNIDLSNYEYKEFSLIDLGLNKVDPYQFYYRAYALEALGFDEPAEKELQMVLNIDPRYVKAHELLGKIYAERGDFQQTFIHLRLAASLSPGDKTLRSKYALVLYDLGEYEASIVQYRSVLEKNPDFLAFRFLLARALVKNKEFNDAYQTLKEAYARDHKAIKEVAEIADMLKEIGESDLAVKFYKIPLDAGEQTAYLYYKIALVYEENNDIDSAKKSIDQVLILDPDNGKALEMIKRLGF